MFRYQTQKIWTGLLVFFFLITACAPLTVVPKVEPTISVTSPPATPTLTVFLPNNINRITTPSNWRVAQSSFGKGAITYGEFSPDAKSFGVVIPLGVYIYDVETLKQQQFFPGDAPVRAAAFSPDWSLLAMGTGSNVTLQQLLDEKVMAHLETQQGLVSRLRFSPDGSLLAVFVTPPGEEVYSKIVELWRVSDRKLLSTWNVSVYDGTTFSADGKTFYAWTIHGSQMEGVRRWQVPSGTPLPAWKDLYPFPIAFSQDGNLYAADNLWATGRTDGIVIQNVSTKTQVHKLSIGDSKWVYPLQFSPDGSLLVGVTNNNLVKVWRIADETLLYSFEAGSSVNLFLAISADNKTLAIPTPDGIAFYNLTDGSLLNQLSDHFNAIDQAAISPQGDKVAALVIGDGLIVWDVLKGQMAYSLSKVGAIHLAWSPDGNWLALGGWDDSIRLLRAEDGVTMRSLPAHTQQLQSVAFSPDGRLLASSSMESVKVWQFSDGSRLRNYSVPGGWVTIVKFSSDGRFLAATSADGKVEVWQVSNGQRIAELSVPELSGGNVIDFAPVGDFLAIGEMSQIILWRFTESKPFQLLPIGDAKVMTLRISPDGTLLVCGLTDGTIQFWQIPEGKPLKTLRSGENGIVSLDFSADGQILLSASRDGTIHLWSIKE